MPSNSAMVSDDLSKQNEWWTDIIDEDWKEILNETTAIESQPKKYRTARYRPDSSEEETITFVLIQTEIFDKKITLKEEIPSLDLKM
ncbi:hypothetical protein BHE74_00050369 [Ensete ventricosum]|nr:hypothetical protein GW17_00034277 [Ensete ventricosum]RWW43918.1 hypothetical protein BHE74_00050369 [Ensete ventricosum]